MADLNKVFLMGSLTFDPELRRTPSGTAVSELRLVTSRTWMSREGERREEKLFIDVTVWDRQAEVCCERLRKRKRDPRRRRTQDGYLGRQKHGRKTLENPRAGRARSIPRQPSWRFAGRNGRPSRRRRLAWSRASPAPDAPRPRRVEAPVPRARRPKAPAIRQQAPQ